MHRWSRAVLSSIHIEPVDSDEYNQSLVEQLTTFHKQKFLQHVRDEPNFLCDLDVRLCERLVNELNGQKTKCSQTEWLNIFKAWKDFVRKSTATQLLTTEDEELLGYIQRNESKKPVNKRSTTKSSQNFSTHCRICLASSSSKMLFLFEEQRTVKQTTKEMTLLDKLNFCACFASEATVDDNLPKYICLSCSILVENAYQLKVLCGRTEKKFRDLCEVQSKHDHDDAEKSSNDLEIQCHTKIDNLDLNDIIEYDDNIQQGEMEIMKLECGNESKRDQDTNNPIEEMDVISSERKSSREYRCDICTAVFSRKCSVIDHMSTNHKQDVVRKKSHQCPECGKWFRVKCSLTIHLRTHTGERPYKCEVCGKTFKTSSAISNHRITHTEAKDFKCSSCPFSTNTKPNLKIHERTHSGVQPYGCHFCSMKFRTASNMVKHMRNIHEKQKSNKCDKCDRSFFTRESLRKHSVIHTGIKPFNCPGCSLAYGWYNGLKKHIRHQHASEDVKIPSEKVFYEKFQNALPQ